VADQLRLRYSGVITFLIRLLSLVTGFVFTLLVTNTLSESDFGVWQIVQNSHAYTMFLLPMVTYWTVRYIDKFYLFFNSKHTSFGNLSTGFHILCRLCRHKHSLFHYWLVSSSTIFYDRFA
jgi:O-antigen/teichoic acid export membrane protein